MERTFGSPSREIETFSTKLWEAEHSFPGINRATGVDARQLTHIFGEGSKGNSIRQIELEAFGSEDIMGGLDAPIDNMSLLHEIASQARDGSIKAIIDALNGN